MTSTSTYPFVRFGKCCGKTYGSEAARGVMCSCGRFAVLPLGIETAEGMVRVRM